MVPEKGEKEMEKVEITDEMIERIIETKGSFCAKCEKCAAFTGEGLIGCVRSLASLLKSERAERAKNDVWNGAPEWAINSFRVWNSDDGRQKCSETITRELPKTKAREIAEGVIKVFMKNGTVLNDKDYQKMVSFFEQSIDQILGNKN